MYWDFIWKSSGFIPFRTNLTRFSPKYDILQWQNLNIERITTHSTHHRFSQNTIVRRQVSYKSWMPRSVINIKLTITIDNTTMCIYFSPNLNRAYERPRPTGQGQWNQLTRASESLKNVLANLAVVFQNIQAQRNVHWPWPVSRGLS